MAQIFSVPVYVPDPTSGEVVTGYDVQVGTQVSGSPFITNWTEVEGSPFSSNLNIIDPSGTVASWYQVKPIRTLPYANSTVTIDTPWSKPFQASTPLYDAVFTRLLLPTARFTYLGDQGISQTNGTNLMETTGAGAGQWLFDGTKTLFNLQYVMNDDPIKLLDDAYNLVYTQASSGTTRVMVPYVDYIVDVRAGTIQFAVAPVAGDYARFQFLMTDFVNDDLLQMLVTGVNALSQYGLNGYQVNTSYNLQSINKPLQYADLAEIVVKVGVLRLREGLTERAMRSTTAWREGSASMDPFPSRALQFLVDKTDLNDTHVRKEINTFIRGTTLPLGRGEFDIFWDLTQLTPLTSGMFHQMPGGAFGSVSSGLGAPVFPWYV
jgi:hypothetical protein